MNRALLVGINNYPTSPLRGCINDVIDISQFLTRSVGFKTDEIKLLTDERATKKGILENLSWLISGVKAGDHIVFHFSGHGVQMPTKNASGEIDGLDEVICPYDFIWTEETSLRDKEFSRLLSSIPKGVQFTWISDSCHSGDLHRKMREPHRDSIAFRTILPPVDIAWELKLIKQKGIKLQEFREISNDINGLLISGCKPNQLSADAFINGRFNGAMTYFLLEVVQTQGRNVPMTDIIIEVNKALDYHKYDDQDPELYGNENLKRAGFLSSEEREA